MIDRCLTNFFSRMMLLFAICFSLQCNPAFSVKFLGFIERNKKVECSLCHKPCILESESGKLYDQVAKYYKYENKEPNFCSRCFRRIVLPFEVGLVVNKLKITKNWFPSFEKDKNCDLLTDEQPLVCVLNKECIHCLQEIKFNLYRDVPVVSFCGSCFAVHHIFCKSDEPVKCACGKKLNCIKVDCDNDISLRVWQAYSDDKFNDYYKEIESGTDRIEVLNRYYKSEEEAKKKFNEFYEKLG